MRHPLKKIFLIFFLSLYGLQMTHANSSGIDSLLQKVNTATDSEKVFLFSNISKMYLDFSLSSGMEYALKALSLADSLGNKHLIAEAYNRLGTVYYFLNNYEKAIFYIIQSLKIREDLDDLTERASSYTNLAIMYMAFHEYDKAIYYNTKSIELKKELDITKNLGANYNNMMLFYEKKKDWNSALYWGYKTLDYYKKIKDIQSIADAYLNIGEIYHLQKDYNRALTNYQKALSIANKVVNTFSITLLLNSLSQLYLDIHKPAKAFNYLQREKQILKNYYNPRILINYHLNLSRYYKENKDYGQAYKNLKIAASYQDTTQKKNAYDKILSLQKSYDSQNMEYQLRTLKQDQLIKKLKLKKEKHIMLGFGILSILLFILIIFIIYSFRRLKNLRNEVARHNQSLHEANIKLFETEKQLQTLNQTKDKFFSILAHDLINPFQPILGLSELLVTDLDRLPDEDIKKYASLIKESTMRLFNLLSNLLKWTQTQTGRLSYDPENICLPELVNEIFSFYKENARLKNIHLLNHIDKEILVYADRELLSATIRNLVSNAIKFTNNNGYVKVDAKEKNGFIEVSVEDNGIGINPTRLEKIFSLESAVSTKGTQNEKGTGLGLILCKEFVAKNGGNIRVTSRKGKGTVFYFTLPKANDNNK